MVNISKLLTKHIDIWTAADNEKKSGRGRTNGNASSVYGVKKLRELILELAVRGKLVPQDPNVEPASELLKRIQDEKTKLILEGKLKKEKPLAPISEDGKPFELPSGWAYASFGDVVEIVRGITFPGSEKTKTPENGRVACLRTTNVQNQIEWEDILYIRESFVSRDDQILMPNDIVMSMANSRELVGKVALVGNEIKQRTSFGGFLGVIRPYFILPKFVVALLRTPHTREELIDNASQTTNIANISLAKLKPLFFAIPPLAEQHRIVAKVDELMALCDQLEQKHGNAQDAHETLVSQLLATLTQSKNAAEFNSNWQRIYVHFDVLFTTEVSIDALKKTLLQLALMGKLVPQDPNDEHASELLKRIQAEKTKLIAEGNLKKEKPLASITDDEKPFSIPETWCWIRLGNIHEITSSKRIHAKDYQSEGVPFFRSKEIGELGRGREISTEIYISQEQFNELKNAPGFPHCGDLMLASIGGSIGNNWLCDNREFYYKDGNITKIGNHYLVNMFYLKMFIDSSVFWSQVTSDVAGSAYNALTIIKIKELSYPLPPLNEQHRIVAKVDELMALCDQLKTRIQKANQQQQVIADALVAQAVV